MVYLPVKASEIYEAVVCCFLILREVDRSKILICLIETGLLSACVDLTAVSQIWIVSVDFHELPVTGRGQ